jgi:thioredoxin-related protein
MTIVQNLAIAVKTNRTIASLLLFFACLASSSVFAEDAPKAVWLDNYNDALAQAKAQNKRVLVDFTGSDWCYFCKKMDSEVLGTPKFAEYADKNLVLLIVDFPQRKELPKDVAERNDVLRRVMHVDGFPTFVVLNSDGDEIDRRVGYLSGGPKNFIRFLKVSENAAPKE